MRALTFLLVLTAGCRAENATKNATANATGAATSTLVELDEKKPRRRPKKTTDEATLDQLLEQLFEANSIKSAAAATPAQKKKRRKKAKDLDVSDDSERASLRRGPACGAGELTAVQAIFTPRRRRLEKNSARG